MENIGVEIRFTVDQVVEALEAGKRNFDDFNLNDPLYFIFESIEDGSAHSSFTELVSKYTALLEEESNLGNITGWFKDIRKYWHEKSIQNQKLKLKLDCALQAKGYIADRIVDRVEQIVEGDIKKLTAQLLTEKN